jgi:hypothetical protein
MSKMLVEQIANQGHRMPLILGIDMDAVRTPRGRPCRGRLPMNEEATP